MNEPEYINLSTTQSLPDLSAEPFRAVLICEHAVDPEWQHAVSEWLVRNGCLYMMAWGPDSSSWDDSVDYANLDEFGYGDIPDDKRVMTSWHDQEPLSDTLWFAHHAARHPDIDLPQLRIVDISQTDRRTEMMAAYNAAIADNR